MRALQRFFGSWRFPALTLPLLLIVQLALLGALLAPADAGPLSRFAEELKVWCFGYDPRTGALQASYVVMFLVDPLLLAALIALVWWRPLSRVGRRLPWAFVPYAGAAALAAGAAAVALGAMASLEPAVEPTAFPADRLRVSQAPPSVAGLVDQEGRPVRPEELHGRVVVLTAVYATCGYTCPMIMAQARAALDALAPTQRERVTVLGVTLDPERDDVAAMARMAEGQGVAAPGFRLLSGPPARVDAILDAMGVTRTRDPTTGVIDHANVFLLIDGGGRVAYRFGLGELQERWLTEALRLLADEAGGRGGPSPPS